MPLLRCELACGSGGRGESGESFFGENAWMLSVSVESRDQRCSFTHDTNPRMMMAMNATFMGLRQSEPTLKVQVVMGIIGQFGTREQADLKRRHHLRHVVVGFVIGERLKLRDLCRKQWLSIGQ